jgi:hypothetical protein
MTTSGSPKEPKNEQQAAGHSQSSPAEVMRGLAVMGYCNKRGAQSLSVMLARLQLSFLFDCELLSLK